MILISHRDPPGALEVKPQPRQFTSEPGEVGAEVSVGDPGAEFLEHIFTRPGKVTKGKNVLNLLWRREFIEDSPGPLLCHCSVVKLNPEAAAIFAVNLKTEQVSLLQLFNQTKRNVKESWGTAHIQPGWNNTLDLLFLFELIYLKFDRDMMPPLVSPINRTLSPGMTGCTTVRLSLSFTGDLKYHISHDHSLSVNFLLTAKEIILRPSPL